MAHTPGPWGVERDGFTLFMSDQCVATAIAPDGADVETQRANARLIAAAPDLYAALRAACDLLRKRGVRPGDPTYAAARAALAKVDA